MWHENEEEMVQMLKSIFRMDVDQGEMRITHRMFKFRDPDYYEFEGIDNKHYCSSVVKDSG